MQPSDKSLRQSEEVIEDDIPSRTVLHSAYFDELVAALEDPPKVLPKLFDAIQKHAQVDA